MRVRGCLPVGNMTIARTSWAPVSSSTCFAMAASAVLTKAGPEIYHAHFFAWYKRVLTFSYATDLRVERRDGETVFFRGQSDLGKLAGGVYRYEGHASPGDFFSTYTSKYDVGTFTLRRPLPVGYRER